MAAAGGGKVPEEEIARIEEIYGIKINREGNLGRQLAWTRDKLAMSYLGGKRQADWMFAL